jgi:coatomer protein complex subunit gamma
LDDVDDEVRDRAAMYLKVMKEASLADTYVKEGMLIFDDFCSVS